MPYPSSRACVNALLRDVVHQVQGLWRQSHGEVLGPQRRCCSRSRGCPSGNCSWCTARSKMQRSEHTIRARVDCLFWSQRTRAFS